MASAKRVLIVEDEGLIAEHLATNLEGLDYAVCGVAATAREAVRLAREQVPALVIMDVRLAGDSDGVEAAVEIRRQQPVPVVFMTGSGDRATLARIEASGPAAVLIKPIRLQDLHDILARVCPPD